MPNEQGKRVIDNSPSKPTLKDGSPEAGLEKVSNQKTVAAEARPTDALGPVADDSGRPTLTLPEAKGSADTPRSETTRIRELERTNKELLVQIKELQLEHAQSDREAGAVSAEGYGAVAEKSQSVMNIVRDLEGQLDNAFALKKALEADLAATQARLSEESRAICELEARVQLLEAQVALAEQLREELSFVEEERNEIARKLKESQAQLGHVTNERDALAEQVIAAETSIKNLELEKVDLEAQVLNLKDEVQDLEAVRKQLEQVAAEREDLIQQVQDLTGRLAASEASKIALELDLTTSQKVSSDLREEVKGLQHKLTTAEAALTDLGDRIEEQQVENQDLVEANERLEREVKTLIAKNEAVSSELEVTKKALHDIHSAASRTTKRIYRRYYKAVEGTDKANEKDKEQS